MGRLEQANQMTQLPHKEGAGLYLQRSCSSEFSDHALKLRVCEAWGQVRHALLGLPLLLGRETQIPAGLAQPCWCGHHLC